MSLAHHAKSAVIWNAGFNIFRNLLQFMVMLVLVRLLPPVAYGQFSLVNSIIGFLSVFSFTNFIAHTLQVKTDEEAHFQDHFTAGAVLQIGMCLMANLVAAALRWFPNYAPVAPLVHVMSVIFLLDWPCEFRRNMILRKFDWRSLRLLQGIGLLFTAAVAIGMALLGAGTFALLVPGLIVTLPFIYDLLVRQRWRPTWAWSWKNYRPSWEFGLTRIGSGVMLNGRQLLESGVLSAVLGFAALGVFNRSIGLAQIFCYQVATQLLFAIYPVLTRIGGGEENSQRVGGLVLRTVAWAVLPVAVCFGILAHPIVETIYGTKWMAVIPLLPWAMAYSAMASLVYASYMLLLARQQQRKCLMADVLSLTGTGLSLWFALPHGVVAYLMSVVSVQLLIMVLLSFWSHKCKAVAWRGVAEALLPALAGVVVATLGATALLRFVFGIKPDNFWHAMEWGVVFLALYVGVLRLGFINQLTTLIYYFPARERIGRLLLLPSRA